MFMLRAVVVSALVLLSTVNACAGEKRFLSGHVGGVLPSGEYIVKSVLTVPQGDTFGLSAGTMLYFEQFTGIEVFGELSIDGTPAAPVVLTSVNDTGGAAQAFDWNGVEAGGGAAVIRIRHARIGNSVYGVRIRELSASVEFERVVFQNNGYASLTRGGQEIPLAANEPFSAEWNAVPKPHYAKAPGRVKSAEKPPVNKKRVAFGAAGVGIAAAGLTICAVNLSQMHNNFRRYDMEDDPRQSTKYKKEINLNTTMSGVGTAVAGLGLLCAGITLFW